MATRHPCALVALSAMASAVAWPMVRPGIAHAYTFASAVSEGCHERITSEALRAVRLEIATAAPLATDRNERALIADVEFRLADDMRDLGGASLLLGVRDNDLKGRQSSDITRLAMVHGDPALQREHCLRSVDDDEPGGSEAALARCRDFILERVAQATAGLDAAGMPDLANRTSLPVYLALRHRVAASLPTYYVRIGQALHALEDSFTHVYRTADGASVTAVLNWVDQANGTLVELSDGPPHANGLDHCDDADDLLTQRRRLATDAATAVLRATLDPARNPEQKTAAVTAVLDQVLGFAPGCSSTNGWCEAPERKYVRSAIGCGVAGSGHAGGSAIAAVLCALTLARARRRRTPSALVGVIALLLTGASRRDASAADAPTPGEPGVQASAPQDGTQPSDGSSELRWGGYLGSSGSLDNGALAFAGGARLGIGRHWAVGVDAEWNPWFAVNGASSIRAGAFNGYASGILRIPLASERFNLRVTGSLGMSTLLIDLYGAPRGSTGIFLGLTPLGIEWEISRRLFVVFNPIGYALPVPQLNGVPFAFPQYRTTVGLELYGP